MLFWNTILKMDIDGDMKWNGLTLCQKNKKIIQPEIVVFRNKLQNST